jgi:hydroxymethylbilane synthase
MLTIGSRGSKLALWQAHHIAAALAALGHPAEIRVIRTTGDEMQSKPLPEVGGKGLFTKEIEDALLDGSIDLAVHSLKDLPTEMPAGLVIAAVPEREDVRDALCGSTLDALPQGARIGTSSLRRSSQLRRLRPDLAIENIRGNVDTRLRKMDDGQFDAILLASAGLNRLGLDGRIGERLDPARMCPAVGQGALAVETKEGSPAHVICSALEHAATRAAVTAERALLAALGGGCQIPVGAYAVVDGARLSMIAIVASPDGTELISESAEGDASEPASIGESLARALLARGADRLLLA